MTQKSNLTFGVYNPILGSPLQGPYVSTEEEDSKKGKSGDSTGSKRFMVGGLTESMLNILLDHGLKSDIVEFFRVMGDIIQNAYDPITNTTDFASYKLMLPKLTEIRDNYDSYLEARKAIQKDETSDEIAVNSRGRVYVMTKKGIVTKTPSQLKLSDVILTNGDLLKSRYYDGKLAFNQEIINSLASGVSTKKISLFVLENIEKLGNVDIKLTIFKNATGQVLNSLQALLQVIQNGDPFLKETKESKDQLLLAELALKYIYTMLPTKMGTVLRIRASQNNTSPEKILANLVFSTLNYTEELSYTFDNTKKKGKSGSTKDPADLGIDLTPLILYLSGNGGIPTTIKINPGVSMDMKIPGKQFNLLLTADGKPVPNGSLLSVRDSGIGAITDMSNGIYIGNQLILPYDFNLIYVETGQVARAYLPTTVDEQGVEHPDFDILPEYIRVTKLIESRAKSREDVIGLIKDSPILSLYCTGVDKYGNPIWEPSQFKPYLLLNVLANGDDPFFSFNDRRSPLDPDVIGQWGTKVEKMGLNQKDVKNMLSSNLGTAYRLDGDVFASVAYIPLSNSVSSAMSASGLDLKEYNTKDPTKQDDIRIAEKKQQEFNPGLIGSNVL